MNHSSRLPAILFSLALLSSASVLAQSNEAFCEEEAIAAGMTAEEDIENFIAQCLENIQLPLYMEVTSDILPDADTGSSE